MYIPRSLEGIDPVRGFISIKTSGLVTSPNVSPLWVQEQSRVRSKPQFVEQQTTEFTNP